MTARARKALGSVAIVLFVALYAFVVTTIGDHIPKAWWVQLLYYLIGGTAWGLPILPLMMWMNRGK